MFGPKLGRGSQGRTYAAIDIEADRAVAIKRMTLDAVDDWKPFDLFERECRVLRALDHDGIPAFFDSFEEPDGTFNLVMELVEGTNLRNVSRDGERLSEAQAFSILHQILEIIDYLHSLSPPVIHRDIKPANIMRRADGRYCLVDFGGVRDAVRPDGGSTIVGTFGYMAPEQLHGEATAATDIYSLGATILAVLTGTEPEKLPRKGLTIDLAACPWPASQSIR